MASFWDTLDKAKQAWTGGVNIIGNAIDTLAGRGLVYDQSGNIDLKQSNPLSTTYAAGKQIAQNLKNTGTIAYKPPTPAPTYAGVGRPVASAIPMGTPRQTFGQITTLPSTQPKQIAIVRDEKKKEEVIPANIGTANVSDEVRLQLAKRAALSSIDPRKLEDEALAELTPYYNRLLDESKGDIDVAKTRMEDDYQKGLRQRTQDTDISKKQLATNIGEEQVATMEDLNRRGLLGSYTGEKKQPFAMTTSTGEALNVSPVTQMQYGGLAGKRMALLQTGQQARAEAVQRALDRANEEAATSRTRYLEDQQKAWERKQRELQQQKVADAASKARSMYSRELAKKGLQQEEALSPFIS